MQNQDQFTFLIIVASQLYNKTVLKPFGVVLFILFSFNSWAQNLEESLMILAQSLSGEVSTLIGNVETILPDLESHIIDEQNPKPKILFSKVLGIGMAPSVDASPSNYLIAAKTLGDEEKLKKIAHHFNAKDSSPDSYYFSPIQDEERKIVLLGYLWKNRKILIFLEHDYFQSVSHGQTLLFQDIWLLTKQNLIISHSNSNWFAQKLSDLEYIKTSLFESDASGRWSGSVGDKKLILFFQTIPNTNLKLIGVQFPDKTIRKSQTFLIIGSALVILGLGIGYFYYIKTNSARQPQTHQDEKLQNVNVTSNKIEAFNLDDFMKTLSHIPLTPELLEPYRHNNDFKFAYEYVVAQIEQNLYLRTVSPWASLYLDKNKFPQSWMSIGELFDKLSNLRFIPLDKIYNLIQIKDQNYKISPQAIQNILLTIHSFLEVHGVGVEIKKLVIDFVADCLEARLVVAATVKKNDLDWLNWVIQNALNGRIVMGSQDEYTIIFPVPVEIQLTNTLLKNRENIVSDISIKPLQNKNDRIDQFATSIGDQEIHNLLSDDSLNKTIAILEDVPQSTLPRYSKTQEEDKLKDHFTEIQLEPRKPKVLEIATLIRKPKGK